MPPRGHTTRRELISARDLDELAWTLAEAEQQQRAADRLRSLVAALPGVQMGLAW
jgi:hypothetical protein